MIAGFIFGIKIFTKNNSRYLFRYLNITENDSRYLFRYLNITENNSRYLFWYLNITENDSHFFRYLTFTGASGMPLSVEKEKIQVKKKIPVIYRSTGSPIQPNTKYVGIAKCTSKDMTE